jgi:hypothetical protein
MGLVHAIAQIPRLFTDPPLVQEAVAFASLPITSASPTQTAGILYVDLATVISSTVNA